MKRNTRTGKPSGRPAVKHTTRAGKTYHLFSNGELWTTGRYALLCGYVANPANIAVAIEVHEEEMQCILASARAEFGI